MSQNTKTLYTGLDLFKYIAACLIVWLHVVEVEDIYMEGIVYSFTRFAVPFFFLTSGFLLNKGVTSATNSLSYFKKYIKKLFILFLFWGVFVYGILAVREYFFVEKDNSVIRSILLTVRRVFIIGPCQTWYLLSLLLSVCIIFLLYRYNKFRFIIFLIIICFILNILYKNRDILDMDFLPFNYFNKAITVIYSNENNFILTGLPFTGLGFILGNHKMRLSLSAYTVLFVCVTATSIIEYIAKVKYGKTLTISFALQAILFFFMAISIKTTIKRYKMWRNASTVTYLFHWLVLYEMINPLLTIVGISPYQVYLLPIKLVITLIVCFVVYMIIKIIDNRHLNTLFGV